MGLTRLAQGSWRLDAEQPLSYTVQLIDNVLDQTFPIPAEPSAPDVLGRTATGSPRRLVVVDANVLRLYGEKIHAYLTRHEIVYRLVRIRGGESAKTMQTVLDLCWEFDDFGVARFGEPVIGFVGGVGSDVLGLAASLYRRGISRIEYATTPVGAVDACIALKTGVDFNNNKNRLGTYRPPEVVIVDRQFFRTVKRRRISDALAEMLKIGIVLDRCLFDMLEQRGTTVLNEAFQGTTDAGNKAALAILDASISGMLGELAPNALEHNPARATYYGHTWSPAIEMAALRESRRLLPWRRRRWLYHGEAVALDMLLSAGLALDAGLIGGDEYDRIAAAFGVLELPTWDSLLADSDLLAAGLADATRHRGGRPLVPLPRGLGEVTFEDDITPARVSRAVARQRAIGGRALG